MQCPQAHLVGLYYVGFFLDEKIYILVSPQEKRDTKEGQVRGKEATC